MANRRYERLFRDPEVKEEMLDLRRQGYSFSDIARKYGADHTTIIFHCLEAGLALKAAQRREMNKLIRQGLSVDQVGEILGVAGSVVDFYCKQHGVPGSDVYPTANYLKAKRLELTENQMHAMEKRNAATRKRLREEVIKVDDRGVAWRRNEFDEWICIGRSEYHQDKLAEKEKKRLLNLKRLEMLKY